MEAITFESMPAAISLLLERTAKVESLLEDLSKKGSDAQLKEQLLSVSKAAAFLGLKEATVYTKVSKGELPCMKRNNRLYFSQNDLLSYLEAGRKKTVEEIQAEASQYVKRKGVRNGR